jgi:plasmid stabilization system protein ParE
VTSVVVTPRAARDIDDAIGSLGLPANTWRRVARSLRLLQQFPRAGRALQGRWAPMRFVLGPWPWMILIYVYDEDADRVSIVAMYDARSSIAPDR